jgi:magnesium transporter
VRHPLLVPDLRELLHDGESDAIRDFLSEYHPGRIAELIEDLEADDGDALFRVMEPRAQAEVLPYLEPVRQARLIASLPSRDAAEILRHMPHDERADLVNRLDETIIDPILHLMAQAERDDIRRLTSYEPGTAAAAMTTDYVTLPPNITVREALEQLRREAPDRETIYYGYVLDRDRKLIGFVSLKKLILARRNALVEEVMRRDVIFARADQDQESAARQIDRYDLIAIPVIDADDRLIGIITHDDAMDILRQEQTADMLAFGGVASDEEAREETYWQGRVVEGVRRRIGWLLFLFVAGFLTKYVSHYFKDVQLKLPDLIDFVPLMIGTGGNAGSQTVGTIIRAMALGEVSHADGMRVLVKELLTGLLLGLALGTIGFLYIRLIHGNWAFAAVIGLATLFICMWANVVGSLVPFLARRFGIDPAVVSAPLISTLVDATGLVIFYSVAILLLIKLAHT